MNTVNQLNCAKFINIYDSVSDLHLHHRKSISPETRRTSGHSTEREGWHGTSQTYVCKFINGEGEICHLPCTTVCVCGCVSEDITLSSFLRVGLGKWSHHIMLIPDCIDARKYLRTPACSDERTNKRTTGYKDLRANVALKDNILHNAAPKPKWI